MFSAERQVWRMRPRRLTLRVRPFYTAPLRTAMLSRLFVTLVLASFGFHPVAAQQRIITPDSVRAGPVCVQDSASGELVRSDTVLYRLTRDSVVLRGGERLRLVDIHPPVLGFAAPGGDFAGDTTCLPAHLHPKYIRIFGQCYTMFGHPRIIDPSLLSPAGIYQGVSVFFARGTDLGGRYAPVFYVLREEGCRFQPYSVPIT